MSKIIYICHMTKEFHPGISPTEKDNPTREDFKEEIDGLIEAINATKKRIETYKNGVSVPDLEVHLKSLEERLGRSQRRKKSRGY